MYLALMLETPTQLFYPKSQTRLGGQLKTKLRLGHARLVFLGARSCQDVAAIEKSDIEKELSSVNFPDGVPEAV